MQDASINSQTAEYLAKNGYRFEPTQYISEGFEIFKKNVGGFVLFTFILAVFQGAAEIVHESLGSVINALTGPLSAGMFVVAHKIRRGESTTLKDFFSIAQNLNLYLSLLGLNILIAVIFILGLIVLVLPGIYLIVCYSFAIPFFLFGSFGIWEAMEASRKVVAKNWFSIFTFFMLSLLVLIGGILCLGVGILAAAPIVMCSFYAAFADVLSQAGIGTGDKPTPKDPIYEGF